MGIHHIQRCGGVLQILHLRSYIRFFTASHVHLRTYARMSMRARTYNDCTETKKVFIRTP